LISELTKPEIEFEKQTPQFCKTYAKRLGSAAGGGTGLAGLVKPIIALHALGRMQAARPLQPVLGRFSTATVRVASD
jgi:hypothetical protein